METVYLLNGQKAYLNKTLEDGYLVNKVISFKGVEDEEILEETSWIKECFKNPPIEKFHEEIRKSEATIIELTKKISELSTEKWKIDHEIKNSTKTLINSKSFVINKTELINATSIVMFTKKDVMPIKMDNKDKSMWGISLTLEIKIGRLEVDRSWGYKIYEEYKSSGDYLCEKYGILINPSEEEVVETIKKRLLEFKFSDYQISIANDEYLTEELLAVKYKYIKNQNNSQRISYQKEIDRYQELLRSISNVD